MICPYVPEETLFTGGYGVRRISEIQRLKVLNASAWNCALIRSPVNIFLKTDVSTSA